jgi:hypothetical protein
MPRTTPIPRKLHNGFPLAKDPRFLALPRRHRKYVFEIFMMPFTGKTFIQCFRDSFECSHLTNKQAHARSYHIRFCNKNVQSLLKDIEHFELEQMGVTAHNIIKEEWNIANSDIGKFFNKDGLLVVKPNRLPMSVRKSIKSFKAIQDRTGNVVYEYKLWDKGQALSRLQQIKGMHAPTKHEVTGKDGEPIKHEHNVKHAIDLSALTNKELKILDKVIKKLSS